MQKDILPIDFLGFRLKIKRLQKSFNTLSKRLGSAMALPFYYPTFKYLLQKIGILSLKSLHIEKENENIIHAYNELSAKGREGLNQRGAEFHVGTT